MPGADTYVDSEACVSGKKNVEYQQNGKE